MNDDDCDRENDYSYCLDNVNDNDININNKVDFERSIIF